MGSGEDYIHTWHEWADGQTQDALIDYFEQHRPPQEWFDFVADRLYPDVAGNDIETAITMLADQYAWVDLEAWRKCSDKLLGSE